MWKSAIGSLNTTIGAAKDAVTQLTQDLEAYRQTAAMPSYSPPHAPEMTTIQSLLTGVSKLTTAWKAKGDQYRAQVGRLSSKADSIATHAQNTYC